MAVVKTTEYKSDGETTAIAEVVTHSKKVIGRFFYSDDWATQTDAEDKPMYKNVAEYAKYMKEKATKFAKSYKPDPVVEVDAGAYKKMFAKVEVADVVEHKSAKEEKKVEETKEATKK